VSEHAPNSHKYKEEQRAAAERKIETVVSGPVKVKKKSEISKFAGKIFSTEDMGDIRSYLVDDVLIPGVKNTILDIIIDGASRILGGKGRRSSARGGSKISYRDYYEQPVGGGSRTSTAPASRPRFDFDEIIFPTRIDAENVRDQMDDVIQRYGFVTVGDMYDMADLPQPYTSQKYGWTSIVNSSVIPVRDGYVIKLPKASPIER
jgi:hypothetical protein